MISDVIHAALLGILEGVTEFLPISSTGHLILAEHVLGWETTISKTFDVVIQLGAILAICVLYFARLWSVTVRLPSSARARNFVICVLIAFLPAAVVGALFHTVIKNTLFTPQIVLIAMVIGGVAIILIEKYFNPADRFFDVEQFTPQLAFKIGLMQLLALIPGMSRSGATIMGGVLCGASRQAAAEFSFLLAIPTMFGATVYELYKGWHDLSADNLGTIGIGFITAFISALIIVRWLVGFVSRHGFTVFGWYRIIAGGIGLLLLLHT